MELQTAHIPPPEHRYDRCCNDDVPHRASPPIRVPSVSPAHPDSERFSGSSGQVNGFRFFGFHDYTPGAVLQWHGKRLVVPAETVLEIAATRRRGGRVIAVGTSVVRAIEGAAELGNGALGAATGVTSLRIGPQTPIRWIDGLLTGLHEPTESHLELMGAFIDEELQHRVATEAAAQGLEVHEFGDVCLLLPSRPRPPPA